MLPRHDEEVFRDALLESGLLNWDEGPSEEQFNLPDDADLPDRDNGDEHGVGPCQGEGQFECEDSAVVPEPATMTLLATGLAGLFGVGVRRRNA